MNGILLSSAISDVLMIIGILLSGSGMVAFLYARKDEEKKKKLLLCGICLWVCAAIVIVASLLKG